MQTTIEFRGMQATYTFPVGVTTLWWYAPNQGNSLGEDDATVTFGNSSETVTFEQRIKGTGAAKPEPEDEPWDEAMYDDNEQTPLFRFRRQL